LAHDDAAPRHRPRGTGLVGFATVGSSIVGIDLGTSNSAVAVCDPTGQPRVLADSGGAKIHPSVVSFHPNGSVVIGAEAKQRKGPRSAQHGVLGQAADRPHVPLAAGADRAGAHAPTRSRRGPTSSR
jgi:hypothetical protein